MGTATNNFFPLELVERVDTWPYYQKDPAAYREWISKYYYFMIEGFPRPFGYVHESVLEALNTSNEWEVDNNKRLLTLKGQHSFTQRTKAMQSTLRQLVDQKLQNGPRKFYGENLAVYSEGNEHILDMDRSGLDPFGVMSYSAHLIAYVNTPGGRRYWVPKRSKTKPTVPSMLDSSVAGVMRSGETPLDCMVRKIQAETSIPEAFTKVNLRACGTVSYQMSITSTGGPGCQHIIHYTYEMELPHDLIPTPNDEVETFVVMSLDQVLEALRQGEFVANRAMVWLSYLIRNNLIKPEDEPNYVEICSRLHRKHQLFVA